jgi:hypothetical protein
MGKVLKPEELAAVVKRVVTEVKGAHTDLKSIRGFFGALSVAPRVVDRVEKVGKELKLIGSDKKEVAVAAVLALVPDRWVPDAIIEPFVRWAIERAVPKA